MNGKTGRTYQCDEPGCCVYSRSYQSDRRYYTGLPEYKDGYVYANDKPGLGVDLNEAEAAKYPCENTVTLWTQTRLRDGSLQTP